MGLDYHCRYYNSQHGVCLLRQWRDDVLGFDKAIKKAVTVGDRLFYYQQPSRL